MKKALNILKDVFVWVVVALAIFMMFFTIISVNTFDRNDRTLLGFRAYIVASDSMSASGIDAGDLILVKSVDPNTLQEGDIIAYISQNSESYGETITHMISRKTVDAQGNPGFVTYGTTTGTEDETVVTYPFVLGKLQVTIPHIGTFFQFLKTPQGYIVCILVPFMLLILYHGLNCINLFRRYKKEQMEEVEDERKKLEEERAESKRLMQELQELRAQLSAGQGAATGEEVSTENTTTAGTSAKDAETQERNVVDLDDTQK